MKMINIIVCVAALTLAASIQSADASPRRGHQQYHQFALPQRSPFAQVEQELYTITWQLSQVRSRRDAEATAREIEPRVRYLERQLNFDRARRSLDRREYDHIVNNTRTLDRHIARLAANNFFGSRNLANVCQRLNRITRPVVQSPMAKPGPRAQIPTLPPLLPPPPVLVPRR